MKLGPRMQDRRFVVGATMLLVAGLILQQHCACGKKTVNPGSAEIFLCSVDTSLTVIVFTVRGGINCTRTVVNSNSLVAGCNNAAGQLAVVFNGTEQSSMLQFYVRIVDTTLTNVCVTCSDDGDEVFGEVHIAGGYAVCPGDPDPVTICTVEDTLPVTVFTASGGITDNCTTAVHRSSLLGGCRNDAGEFALVFNGTADGQRGTIQFTMRIIDDTITNARVTCSAGSEVLGEVFIAGPPSAPDINVTFTEEGQTFVIQWSSFSRIGIDGYQLNVPLLTGLTCDDPNIGANTQYSCSNWTTSVFGRSYTFNVSASNCRHRTEQVGSTSEVTVMLQVPGTATLMTTPVYNQSTGSLLRIESLSSTLPSDTLAITSTGFTLDEEPSHYHFIYNDGTTSQIQTVESGSCTGGLCRDVFTASGGMVDQYEVTVAAENVFGVGESSSSQYISTSNTLLEVEVNVTGRALVCRFLGGFTGTAECRIEYSTQEDLSGSVVDTGSSTSGDTVTVTLTASLEASTTYYYLVTATAEGESVRVQDVFDTQSGQMQGSTPEMKTNIGAIIGGTVGGVAVLVACAFCVIVYYYRELLKLKILMKFKRKKSESYSIETAEANYEVTDKKKESQQETPHEAAPTKD